MKRLFYLICILGIPLLLFFQYDRYRRFHPPTDYTYTVNDSIDVAYHDPGVVSQYYESALECATFARYCWRKHKVDVRTPDWEDPEARKLARSYNQKVAQTRYWEQKLIRSAQWKAQGWETKDIQWMEKQGIDPLTYQAHQLLAPQGYLQAGDEGLGVLELQKLLLKVGRELKVDGIFDQETLREVQTFQQSNNLIVNGIVDKEMVLLLLK